jgi:hypothetical protein
MLHSANVEVEKGTGSMEGVNKSKINTEISVNVLLHKSAQAYTQTHIKTHKKEPLLLHAKMSKRKVCVVLV